MDHGEPTEASCRRTILCTACCVFCDDIVRAEGTGASAVADSGAQAEGIACAKGRAFLESLGAGGAGAMSRGHPIDERAGIARAAEWLTEARSPAVLVGPSLTLEAQRSAVHLARLLRAPILASASARTGFDRLGLDVPEITATLGEVKSTADLVILWDALPERDAPRHLERYSFSPRLRSGGRRQLIRVDVGDAADHGDRPPEDRPSDWTLTVPSLASALQLALSLRKMLTAGRHEQEGGPPEVAETSSSFDADALRLSAAITSARHTHILLGMRAANDVLLRDSLHAMAAAARLASRITIGALSGSGNVRGVDEVATSTLGAPPPLVTAFGPGPTRSWLPGALSVDDLAAFGADVLLVCGRTPPGEPPTPLRDLSEVPRISLDPHEDREAEISFRIPGLDPRLQGTVVRLDGVYLPLGGHENDPAREILYELTRACRPLLSEAPLHARSPRSTRRTERGGSR